LFIVQLTKHFKEKRACHSVVLISTTIW
jgi:hypothetical protein